MSYQQWPAVTAQANSSGVATATLGTLRPGQQWRIGMVAISTNSANTTSAQLLLNGLLVTGTVSGNQDTADGDPPLTISANDVLQVVWQGCNNGDQCTAVFYYEDTAAQTKAPRSKTVDQNWQYQ